MNSELLATAIQVALEAGALLRRGFGTQFEISSKPGMQNLVTDYDHAAEKLIYEALHAKFPTHGFIGEEQGQAKQGDTVWIVDPLDGTVNFAHNIPIFAVSIAAAHQSEIVAGCIFQPMTQELFWAEKGGGAYLNGQRLFVSRNTDLHKSFLSTGFPYNVDEDPRHCIETFSKMTRLGYPIRRLGSAAIDLSYLAAGRFDAYWEVSLQPWDFSAGKLIVEEAGGRISTYDGAPLSIFKPSTIVASNSHLHSQLLEALQ